MGFGVTETEYSEWDRSIKGPGVEEGMSGRWGHWGYLRCDLGVIWNEGVGNSRLEFGCIGT